MKRQRGFTLLEMMVAVAIGAATVVMAAKIAAVVIQQNNLSEMKNDLSLRTRVLSEQLRADIRLAGLGSTGAIGVDPASPVLSAIAIPATPSGGFPAIPAIVGGNNLPTQPFPQGTLEGGSDVVMMVVPNPRSLVRSTARARRNTQTIDVLDSTEFGNNCPLAYIHDHTNPNGAGRTQLAWVQNVNPTAINISDFLQFTAAAGTEVMCARISTYWVDNTGWLHRTDLVNNGLLRMGASNVFVNAGPPPIPDLMAPGIQDLQIAYKVSSEAYRQAVPPAVVPLASTARWAYTGDAVSATALMNAAANAHLWFEVRLIRLNLFARRAKRLHPSADTQPVAAVEDGDQVDRNFAAGGEWIATSEAVTSLKMFDSATAEDVPAEPY